MQYKIESCTRELRPLKGSQDTQTLYTGIKVNGSWLNLRGDHRNLYGKVVDLELNGNIATFAQPQQPPAPAQQPPPPPKQAASNGHTPKWATRDDAVAAYVFYATQVEQWIKEPYAIVKATNCLMMLESSGEINPVHKPEEKEPFKGASNG